MRAIFEFVFVCLYSIPQKNKSKEEKKEIMHGYLWIMSNIMIFSITAIISGLFRIKLSLWFIGIIALILGWFGIGHLLLKKNIFDYLITEKMYEQHSQMYYRMFGILIWVLNIFMIEVSYMFMAYRLHGHFF